MDKKISKSFDLLIFVINKQNSPKQHIINPFVPTNRNLKSPKS